MITPLGNTVESTWKAMSSGESGADYITKFATTNFPVRFAAEVKNFEPLDYFEKKELRRVGEGAGVVVIGELDNTGPSSRGFAADHQLRISRADLRSGLRAERGAPARIHYALSNGSGFGGTNATLVFKVYPGGRHL